MEKNLETIAIVASDECRASPLDGKRWFHLRRFIQAYVPLLSRFRIYATDATAALINEALDELPENDDVQKLQGQIESLGRTFPAVVHVASQVAQRNISKVLMFQDPRDLQVERPERYALLRNCNIVGASLLINYAAHLWALWKSQELRLRTPWPYVQEPVDDGQLQETVALIAHDREKERIGRFALKYRSVLSKFPVLIGTSGTIRYIRKLLRDASMPEEKSLQLKTVGCTDDEGHGPSGGDVIIADHIFQFYKNLNNEERRHRFYSFHHVLFFADYRSPHPHEADIRVLLKTCVDPNHRVNLILNSRMARRWAERYV